MLLNLADVVQSQLDFFTFLAETIAIFNVESFIALNEAADDFEFG